MSTVLLIDDDEGVRESLTALMEEIPLRCQTCVCGDEAIAFLSQNNEPIDLIVCDMEMPFGDGYAVTKFLDQQSKRIPFVLYSAIEPPHIPTIHGMPVPFVHKVDISLILLYASSLTKGSIVRG